MGRDVYASFFSLRTIVLWSNALYVKVKGNSKDKTTALMIMLIRSVSWEVGCCGITLHS